MRRRFPTLNSLKAFEVAARHESISDAAEELCVTSSAVSHQVKLLESNLSIQLFVRNAHSINLSPAGKQLYLSLRNGFDQITEGVERFLVPHRPNVLRIGTYNAFAARVLIPNMAKFMALHPDIQVRLCTSLLDVDLDDEDVDICIRWGKTENPYINYKRVFGGTIFPVCSPALLEKTPQLKHPKDLLSQTIIQVQSCPDDWTNWFNANSLRNVNINSCIQFDSYDMSLSAATQGLGFALAMDPLVSKELELGTLVKPFPELRSKYYDDWYLAIRHNCFEERKVQAFVKWMDSQIDDWTS